MYQDTVTQFRAALRHVHLDLDSEPEQIALAAQAFPAFSQRREQASRATFNQRCAILSSFYTYAMDRNLVLPLDASGRARNPISLVKREKVQAYAGAQALAADDVLVRLQRIDRKQSQGKRDYALLAVLLQTGKRVSEVAALQWQHVNVQGKNVMLTFDHCKGGKTLIDTLPASVSAVLLEWLQAAYGAQLGQISKEAPLWISFTRNSRHRGQALGIQSIADICERYLGISKVHVTRHTFTHLMMKAGATLPKIQARLGHESLDTTGRYARSLTSAENPHAETLAKLIGL
ncbi:MAG: site-specific integrase [Ktedonobacteraceae bacterium]